MKRFSITIILASLLLVTACLPAIPGAPAAPFQRPVLVPTAQSHTQMIASPQRILIIGSLFSQDIDMFLKGLVHAANPTAQLEVASIILPAT